MNNLIFINNINDKNDFNIVIIILLCKKEELKIEKGNK